MASSDVYFGQALPEQFILLQLTPDLLEKRLWIKPASSSASVLCTEDTTYHIKDVQQSNALMFLTSSTGEEPGTDALQLQGEAASWLESTLSTNPVIDLSRLPLYGGETSVPGISRDVLFSSIPASTAQIEAALESQLCLELDQGYVRLGSSYVLRLVHVIVNSLVANGIDLNSISEAQFKKSVADEEEDPVVLMFLLHSFCKEKHPPYQIEERAIARCVGLHSLLLHAKTPIPTTTFQKKWRDGIPAHFKSHVDLSVLQGNYIHPVSTQIQSFSSSNLSNDGKTRMNELLDVKSRWLETEISPFLEELGGGPKGAQSIIMKHARKVKVGKTVFIEKRGK